MKIEPRVTVGKKPEIILIVCEDTKSSTFYLQDKAKSVGLAVNKSIGKINFEVSNVEIQGLGKDPSFLVNNAIERKHEFNKEQKRKKSYPYSKIFCVMDVDDHTQLKPSIESIKRENLIDNETEIIPIVSNQCFELWYVLHFIYTTRELYRNSLSKRKTNKKYIAPDDNLSKLIEKYLGIQVYEKGEANIFELLQLKGNEVEAINHAEKLNRYHLEVNTLDEDEVYNFNPSTQVFKLINKINELSDIDKEVEFEVLRDDELIKLNKYSVDTSFIEPLWEMIYQEYSNLSYSDRFILILEVFEKPYYSKVFIKNERIRTLFNEKYVSSR